MRMFIAQGPNARCSIARSLEVLGERWTLLVVREATSGVTRFSDFHRNLGVAKDILASRLTTLVEHGVLERRAYKDAGERERDEYVLTASGRELLPVLAAFIAWGDRNRPSGFGPAAIPVEEATGLTVRLGFIAEDGREVDAAGVAFKNGPGAPTADSTGIAA
jgi:DNA-binding HxlR family transcriptional regulator